MEQWLNIIKKSKKTAISQGGTLKVHYQLDEKNEMVEEYNPETRIVLRRAFRRYKELKGRTDWDVEIGTPEVQNNLQAVAIKEENTQPFLTRLNSKYNLEWRIRNLPYPIETYSVKVEPGKKCITVRTSNKKYFKNIEVPDVERIGLVPDSSQISFTHKFNTLTITLGKPKPMLEFERLVWEEVKNVPVRKDQQPDDCKPS